jgi:hypothetical protein
MIGRHLLHGAAQQLGEMRLETAAGLVGLEAFARRNSASAKIRSASGR